MASQTKVCRTYDAGVAYATSPANMVDGNTANFASTTSDGDIQENFFSIELFSIPVGSTINGIVVKVQHYEVSSSDVTSVQLIKGGSPVGNTVNLTNRASTTLDTVGGAADLWGTTWAVSDINNDGTDGFGVEITYAKGTGKTYSSNVSYIEVTVYYVEPTTYSVVCAETISVTTAERLGRALQIQLSEIVAVAESVSSLKEAICIALSETMMISPRFVAPSSISSRRLYVTVTPLVSAGYTASIPTTRQSTISVDQVCSEPSFPQISPTGMFPHMRHGTYTMSTSANLAPSLTEPGYPHVTWSDSFVSPPLSEAVTIDGVVDFIYDAYTISTTLQRHFILYLYVWKGDGSGVRGVLFDGQSRMSEHVMEYALGARQYFSSLNIQPVAAEAGDLIVLELLTYDDNTLTNVNPHLITGSVGPPDGTSLVFSKPIRFDASVICEEEGTVSIKPEGAHNLLNGLIWGADCDAVDGSTYPLDAVTGDVTYKTTMTGTLSQVDGRYGKALYCSTLTGTVDNSDAAKFDLTDAISVAVWLRATYSFPFSEELLSKKGAIDGNYPWVLGSTSSRQLYFSINSHLGGATATRAALPYGDTDWHLCVGVYDKNEGKVKVSLDGGVFVEADYSTAMDLTDNLIAICRTGVSYGHLDDTLIWNRALTQAEVSQLYSLSDSLLWSGHAPHLTLSKRIAQATTATAEIISDFPLLIQKVLAETLSIANSTKKHFFKLLGLEMPYTLWDSLIWASDMETLDGADLVDCSRNGTYYKGVITGATPSANGKFGGCYEFDVTTEKVEVSNSAALLSSLSAYTVCFWAKPSALSSMRPFSNWDGSTMSFMSYILDGEFQVVMYTTGMAADSVVLPGVYQAGEWNFFAFGYDSATAGMRGYCNGTCVSDVHSPGGAIQGSTSPLRIGNWSSAIGYLGLIDDAMLFDRLLTEDELRQLYLAPRGLNLNQLNDGKMTYGPGLTDLVKKRLDRVMTGEGLTLTDRLKKGLGRVLSQTFSLSDTLSTSKTGVLAQTVSESIAFVESIARGMHRRIAQSVAFDDVLTIGGTLSRTLSETIAIAHSTAKGVRRAFGETAQLVDYLRRNAVKRIRETVTASDARTHRSSFRTKLTESVTVVDRLVKGLRRAFTESASFVDDVSASAAGFLTTALSETVTVVVASPVRGFHKRIVETHTLDDVLSVLKSGLVTAALAETMQFVDACFKTFAKVLTPSYPYHLLDGLVWAADGETVGTIGNSWKDMAANGTTHEATLHCWDDAETAYLPEPGDVAGHFGLATYFYSAYSNWGEILGSEDWADAIATTGFTVAMWMRRTGTTDYAYVARNRATTNYAWRCSQLASKPSMYMFDSSLGMIASVQHPTTLQTGVFYLVVYQYDPSSKKVRISVNGSAWSESGALTNGPYIGAGPVLLATYHDGVSNRYLSGVWDDVMLWSRVLSIEEVQELYLAPLGLNLNEVSGGKFSEGGGLSVVDTVSAWNLKFLMMVTETISFVDTISRRTFDKIARETVQFAHGISILTALKSIKFDESVQFITTALKTPFKRFRETSTVSADIVRRSIAKRFAQALSAVSSIAKRGLDRRMSQTVSASDRLAKSQRRSFSETVNLSDSIRKLMSKVSLESLTTIAEIAKRTMRMTLRQTLWLFDVLLPSGQKKVYVRETLLFASDVFKGFAKSARETLTVSATSLAGFIIRTTVAQAITLVDGLRKNLVRRLRDTTSFTDSLSKTASLVRSQTFTLSESVRKVGRKVVVQTSRVSDSISKRLNRIISQTMTLDDIVSTLHGGMLTKAVSETLTFVASMSKGAFRRLADSFTLQASFLRSTKVLALYETLTIILQQAKGLVKRLGPNQFYTLWDALLWATDGETDLNASSGNTSNKLALAPITSPPTLGGVSGHYGNATRLLGLTGADNGQYGLIDTDPTGNSTSLISFAMWFKETGADMGYLIAKGNVTHDTSDPFPWGLAAYPFVGESILSWNVNGTANNVISAPWSTDSEWHLVVCCYDKDEGKIKMSVDGGDYRTTDYSADIVQNSVDITIGRFYWAGDTPANLEAVDMDFDDVMFFGRTLTQAEVAQLYTSRVGLNLNNYTSEKHTWGMPISDSVEAKISALGMVLHEAVQLVDTMVKRADIALAQNLSVVGNIVKRGFSKVVRQVITIPAIVHTYHSGYLTRYLEETVKFVESLSKGEQIHLADVFTLYDWMRTTAGTLTVKTLYETLQFVDATSRRFGKVVTGSITLLAYPVKHFSKRLGPHHLYDIWGAIVEAFDMETQTTDYWRCESAAGTGVVLTCAGTAPVTIGGATGKYGNATLFNSAKLQYGAWTTVRTPGPQGSVMAWLKVSSTGLNGTVIARVHGSFPGYTLDWGISLDSGFPKFATTDKNGASASVIADSTISTDEFHLLVATWNASDGLIQLSVDGGAFKTAVLADELTALSGTCYIMGVFQYVNLSGVIDDPVIISRSLTTSEVVALYQARKGLNLNDYTDDKAFWGTSLTDTVTRHYTRALSFEQVMTVVDGISKSMRRVLSQTATLSDVVSKSLHRVLQQTAGFGESVGKLFDRVLVQTAKLEETFSRRFSYARAISEALIFDDQLSWVQYKILALQESLRLADRWSRTHFAIRRFIESLKLADVNISEVTFTILTVTPLAGTFPRPARIATLSLKVSTTAGAPLSNCAVTVAVRRPDGVSWKNLTLTESAYTPGIYSSNFTILGSDQLGSYPFVATARYGLLSVGTYNGFMTVFQGSLAAIHFR